MDDETIKIVEDNLAERARVKATLETTEAYWSMVRLIDGNPNLEFSPPPNKADSQGHEAHNCQKTLNAIRQAVQELREKQILRQLRGKLASKIEKMIDQENK